MRNEASGPFKIAFAAIHVAADGEAVPLGAACVAAAVRADPALAGAVETRIVEGHSLEPAQALARRILDGEPDAVGFSLYCWNRRLAVRTANIIKSEKPGIVLFAGGPDAEALAGDSPRRPGPPAHPFDAVFVGEGEDPVPAWLKTLIPAAGPASRTPDEVPGTPRIAARPGGTVLRGRALSPELLPSPWLGGIIAPAKGRAVAWELTRGCPFSCAYCYEGRGSRTVRRLPEARIEAELGLFARAGVSGVFVLDPTFNLDSGRALRLLSLIAEKGSSIKWYFEVRAELLDRRQAKAFSRLDCSLQIGLQSVHPEVLARIHRDVDRRKFAAKTGILDAEGVVYGLDLIYGLPGDSLDGFRESVDFALGLGPNHLDVFPLAVLPGTELAEKASEWGIEADSDPPYTVRTQPGFDASGMAAAARLAASCSAFYSRGRAVPWFAAALAPLGMRPSTFLEGFSPPPGAESCRHEVLEKAQLTYLSGLYRARGLERLWPALEDLVRFNGAWSRALADGESTAFVAGYHPDLVAGPEILDLRRFVSGHERGLFPIEILPGKRGPEIRRGAKPRGRDDRGRR